VIETAMLPRPVSALTICAADVRRDRRDCLGLWELLVRLAPWVLLARTAHQVPQVPPARRARPGNRVLPVNQVCVNPKTLNPELEE
jgi:hypothetical protein